MVYIPISIIFVICGFILMKFPPKKINGIYGYRTTLSMKNQDTWHEAQKYGGFSMMILGIILGIFGIWSVLIPLPVNSKPVQMVLFIAGIIVMIVYDEMHLRKLFNKDGSRK